MAQVLRATFEAVGSSQLALLRHLDELEAKNRPINNVEERETFFKEISCSTLGLGADIQFSMFAEERIILNENLEVVIRWAAYQTSKDVRTPVHIGKANEYFVSIPICRIWHEVRESLFAVFPLALKHSVSLSREQEGGSKSRGYNIDE